MGCSGVVLFHLNLNYSSIPAGRRAEVVERCYWPMLELLDRVPGLVLAVEASGHTLELAAELDPSWLARLRAEIESGRVEFVGSGDTQLIGPLVPAIVNRWNQRLGQETYRSLLGAESVTALVNEMAWSQGMVDHYLDAGYRAVVMEWNNPRLRHPEWDEAWRYRSARTASPTGRQIGVHWADTTAFQKLQRVAFGEIEQEEYLEWLGSQVGEGRSLMLYSGDAEIFDFRPGRYDTEPPRAEESEWERIARALCAARDAGVDFTLPRGAWGEEAWNAKPLVRLSSCADPIPVKKQPKYNLTRWALSGRDDLRLNAHCFRRARTLEAAGGSAQEWRELCRLWASDLRTHLCDERWQPLREVLDGDAPVSDPAPSPALRSTPVTGVRREGRRLVLNAGGVEVVLNLRRGLAIERATFAHLDADPLLGTLPHGTFDPIHWTADFYTGHTIFELPGSRRVTDLAPVDLPEHACWREGDGLVVEAQVPTALGPLPKRVRVSEAGIDLHYGFSAWGPQPRGSLRTAHTTLFPDFARRSLELRCAQGGHEEAFPLDRDVEHGTGLSPFISARAAFGASEGTLRLVAGDQRLEWHWDPARCPVLPLLTRATIDGKHLTRLAFSLEEIDDTSRVADPEARRPFPDFDLRLCALPVLHPVCQ